MRHIAFIFALTAILFNLPQTTTARAAAHKSIAAEKAQRPLSGQAWKHADRGYKAFNSGNFAAAQEATRSAIKLRPDLASLRLLLIYALQKEGRNDQARNEARQAIAAGLSDPALSAVAGSESGNYPSPRDGAHSSKLGSSVSADAAAVRDRQATASAQEAYTAYAQQDYPMALAKAQQAIALAPNDVRWKRLLITTLAAGDDAQAARALALIDDLLASHPGDVELLMQRGYLRQRFGQPTLALKDFRTARATGRAPPSAILDEGYAQASAGDKRGAALTLKEAIDNADAGMFELSSDRRYATRQNIAGLGREWGGYVAIGYRAGRALSSGTGGTPLIQPGDAIFSVAEGYWRPSAFLNTPTRVFEVYGRASNTLYSSASGLAAQTDPCIGPVDTSQRFKSVSGLPSTVGALGLRFTPSTELQLTFGLERQFNSGRATRESGIGAKDCHALNPTKVTASYKTAADSGPWLAYATYAHYEGTELRTDVPSWFTVDSYVQAGYYWQNSSAHIHGRTLENTFEEPGRLYRDRAFVTAEARVGRSFRLDRIVNNLVLFPHVVMAADKYWDKTRIQSDSLGRLDLQGSGASWGAAVGPGVTVRYWFRDDHYNASKSYMDFTVQYRFDVGGGAADRTKGLFFNMLVSY
ncbi:NfrA family protein [Pollutimonas nitritireducens]|nr:hypothetical protein [Pollutimonas nitritireducens]